MFSMFFGAGNITFPLIIGQVVEGGLLWALIGLIITAVLVPFSGLFAITLFKGSYETFFNRIGKTPGLVVAVILLAILGPFGAVPRCVTLTYSTLNLYFTDLHLLSFSAVSCALIFFCSWKKSRIVDLMGYILSPLLVLFLFVIIIKGSIFSASIPLGESHVTHPFLYGLKEGYNTMDLLAAFFFSSLIYHRLKQQSRQEHEHKDLLLPVLKASIIGASLLGIIYIGFSYVAAHQSEALQNTPIDQLLGRVGALVLGHHAGLIVSFSIALTCLTTAIALTVISAEFLQKRLSNGRLSYEWSLAFILITTVAVSALKFQGIVELLSPVLQVLYPALLVLCLCNIMHKLFHFKPIKVPVYFMFVLMLYIQYFS